MRLSRSTKFATHRQSTAVAPLTVILTILLTACAGEDGGNSDSTLFFSDNSTNTPTTTPVTDTTDTDGTSSNIVRNSPAIITGSDSGIITEDTDIDTDGFLRTSGKLEITDSDTGESSFQAIDASNQGGNFSLDSAGNWSFAADNSLSEIQSLAGGVIETVEIPVSSTDFTVHIITIQIIGTDDPAIISGTDSGEVTEDDDPDGNNQLETSGKLDIIDADNGESVFIAEEINGNYGRLQIRADGNWSYSASNILLDIQKLSSSESLPDIFTVKNAGGSSHDITISINGDDDITVISGDDEESLFEDDDPDNNNLLEASGILNIADGDGELIVFVADNITGSYGDFTIDSDGHWTYAADNTQTAINDLANGSNLIELITVYTNTGTSHIVVITINSYDIYVAWTAPDTREDGSSLVLSDIGSYRIYYGTSAGDYQNSVEVDDSSAIEQTIKGLGTGVYFLVLTTVDVDGRESLYSPEIVLSNQ